MTHGKDCPQFRPFPSRRKLSSTCSVVVVARLSRRRLSLRGGMSCDVIEMSYCFSRNTLQRAYTVTTEIAAIAYDARQSVAISLVWHGDLHNN